MTSTENNDATYTVAEVAKLFRVHKHTVYEMCADGRLPSMRLGPQTIRIPATAVEAFMRGQQP